MSIDLDDQTAQQLLQAASSSGMDVSEYVRIHLLASSLSAAGSKSVIGAMSDHADLLDEVCEEAMKARERDPLRLAIDA